jgi:hypothetical protein
MSHRMEEYWQHKNGSKEFRLLLTNINKGYDAKYWPHSELTEFKDIFLDVFIWYIIKVCICFCLKPQFHNFFVLWTSLLDKI